MTVLAQSGLGFDLVWIGLLFVGLCFAFAGDSGDRR